MEPLLVCLRYEAEPFSSDTFNIRGEEVKRKAIVVTTARKNKAGQAMLHIRMVRYRMWSSENASSFWMSRTRG